MYKEDVDVAKEVKAEISRVIDQWVNDLIKQKIATPSVDQKYQRNNLWDRLKGSLSNLWYGRYNQQNPNYWRNRFGDELGAQESYDPRAFSLQEYKVLKSVVEKTENFILENTSPEIEKLRIVQIIRSSAEKLKQDLINIFVSSCPRGGGKEEPVTSTPDPSGDVETDAEDKSGRSVAPVSKREDEPPIEDSETKGAEEAESPEAAELVEEKPKLRLSKEKYINYKPKSENSGKSLEELVSQFQIVDAILHPDFENSSSSFEWRSEPAKIIVLKRLEDLLHDANLKGARHGVAQKIEKSIEKFKDILSKEE